MKIGILGAGSIGCYVGGMLAAVGSAPVLVGRADMGMRLAGGIALTRHDGLSCTAGPGSFLFAEAPDAVADCDAILVCVKSGATREAGEALAPIVRSGALIVSLQNGVSNAAVLRAALPGRHVLAGMVGFNVAQIGENRFHCGTEGDVVVEAGAGAEQLVRLIGDAGIASHVAADMAAVQWGKLLYNLNNAVNALSGLPLRQQLSERAYRQVFAATIREALAVLKSAGIRPARIGRVAPVLLPPILDLPDWLFTRLAAGMLKIDADARSSMAEDLERGRAPEIDWLNGEIAALGHRQAVATPANDRIIALVNAAFSGEGPRAFSGVALKQPVLGWRC